MRKLRPILEPELSAQTSAKLASYYLSSKIKGMCSDTHCHLGFMMSSITAVLNCEVLVFDGSGARLWCSNLCEVLFLERRRRTLAEYFI